MTPQPAERAPMGEFGRLTNVFLEPKAAFADIAERPRPWVPIVLLVVLSVAFTASFAQRVGWGRFMEQQAERTPQVQNMTAEQRARATETYAKMGGVMDKVMPALPVVMVPAMMLIVAGIFTLVFRTMMASDITFKQLFGITAYASLPDLLMSAAAIAVLFLKNPNEFNMENPVAFNLGAFLDPLTTGKAVMSLATSIDLFTFWKLALLAVGISVAARKMTFGKALAGVTIPWVIWVVCKTGLAALRG
jgi:hypothetical protein